MKNLINGFVVFKDFVSRDAFRDEKLIASNYGNRLSAGREDPLVVFRGLSPTELGQFREVASSHGGDIQPSGQYEPF